VTEVAFPVEMPRLELRGSALERGRQYGEKARDRVRRSVDSYRRVFEHYAQWDWPTVVQQARRYVGAIEQFAPHALEEMKGIAEGAGLQFEDVLALNVRSEVMFASGANANANISDALANECSAFAVLPEASLSGHTLVGQNWDWLLHARETIVFLDVKRDDGPDFVTIVEAGLLAKTGMNSSGLAVCTNTLVSVLDDGAGGVPYHVMLRALLDCESITDGVSLVFSADKALSANYLLGYVDGLAIDLEVIPGGVSSVRALMPEDGLLTHTNHFLSADFVRSDSRLPQSPNTLFRLQCLKSGLKRDAGAITVESLTKILSDHRNAPLGVCSHGDERAPLQERYATIASVIYDLDAKELFMAAGQPCGCEFQHYRQERAPGAKRGLAAVDTLEEALESR
jgi:isopenicillin-N N-acyltransferase like protein